MSEQYRTRERRLANERALYRYSRAFERGDIETIEMILQEASQNEELERMIFAMHELEQPAEQLPVLAGEQHTPATFPQEPVLRSNPEYSTRRQRVRWRVQMLAAVLVVAALITSSVLLFTSRHLSPAPGSHAGTASTTKTVVAAQGMVIALFTNGDIQAMRGGTGQRVWSYATGQGGLGDPNPPALYRGLIVQNQAVYVMAKNSVFVLNEKTGQLLWQKTLPAPLENISPDDSQLLLDGGILYISLERTPQSVVYALRASDGQILWQVGSSEVNAPLLTASNGIAYVAIQNAAMAQTTMQARRGSDGHVLWNYTSPGEIAFATVANQVLYVYAFPGAVPPGDSKLDKRLLAFKTSNGDLIWSQNVHYGNYRTNIAYAQGVLIVSDGYAQICAHSASNGTLLWCVPKQPDYNGIISGVSMATYQVGPDKLYVAFLTHHSTPLSPTEIATYCQHKQSCIDAVQRTHMYNVQTSLQIEALNLQSGQPLWTNNGIAYPDTVEASVSLGLVQPQQGPLLVATGAVQITALDTDSGHKLWQINGSEPRSSVLQIAGMR